MHHQDGLLRIRITHAGGSQRQEFNHKAARLSNQDTPNTKHLWPADLREAKTYFIPKSAKGESNRPLTVDIVHIHKHDNRRRKNSINYLVTNLVHTTSRIIYKHDTDEENTADILPHDELGAFGLPGTALSGDEDRLVHRAHPRRLPRVDTLIAHLFYQLSQDTRRVFAGFTEQP